MNTPAIDHSIRDHARRAPSDSPRWTTCTSAIDYERMFKLASEPSLTKADTDELNALLGRFKVTFEEARSTGYTEKDETIYNVEGTEAHEWAEKVLTGQITLEDVPEFYVLPTGKKNQMREPVSVYVHECQRIAAEDSGLEPFIEAKVPLFYMKDTMVPVRDENGVIIGEKLSDDTGTMDFAVVSQERVRVRDYKHGAGIFNEIDENTQLAIYTLSFMLMLEDEDLYTFGPDTIIEMGIVQPRHRLWVPDTYWTLTYHDLKTFCQHIQQANDIIAEGIDTAFRPSYKACLWCRMKAFCGVRLHHMAQGLPANDGRSEAEFLEGLPTYDERGSEQKFEKALPDPLDRINAYTEAYGVIPVEQLVKIFANKKGIMAFLSDIEKYLTRRALEGDAADGTKLVVGREGNSEWTDEAAAEKLLENQGLRKEERCVIEVISPTKARDLLGDKIDEKKKKNPDLSPRLVKAFKALVTRSPGKKVLALESDKRPAVESNLDGFDDLSELSETDGME